MKKREDSAEVKAVVAILKGIGILLTWPFRRIKHQYQVKGQARINIAESWQKIEELFQLGGESRFKQAVIEADKLLDEVLKNRGAFGKTMGERLIAFKDKFTSSSYERAWEGHKLRNRIVHETNIELLHAEARQALERFRKVLQELRAL